MIDLYTAPTPNGRKVSIALEEYAVAYSVTAVDLQKNEQFEPDFLKMSPNNKICLLYTSPSPRDLQGSRMPSSA